MLAVGPALRGAVKLNVMLAGRAARAGVDGQARSAPAARSRSEAVEVDEVVELEPHAATSAAMTTASDPALRPVRLIPDRF